MAFDTLLSLPDPPLLQAFFFRHIEPLIPLDEQVTVSVLRSSPSGRTLPMDERQCRELRIIDLAEPLVDAWFVKHGLDLHIGRLPTNGRKPKTEDGPGWTISVRPVPEYP